MRPPHAAAAAPPLALAVLAVAVLAIAFWTSACAAFREPVTPIPTLAYPAAAPVTGSVADGPRQLVVFLPGRFDRPKDFAHHGFVAAVRRARPHADVVAVDAHLGYYRRELIAERLWHDVLAPAQERYDEVWLVGVSLGGIGALGITARHPDAVTGVVLIAPFLGNDLLTAEIAAAGGPRGWEPDPDDDDPIVDVWRWIKRWDATHATTPRLYLGFGTRDRLAPGARQLATVLPVDQVVELPGGHDWDVWQKLFAELLERGALEPR